MYVPHGGSGLPSSDGYRSGAYASTNPKALPCCPAGVASWRNASIMKRMRSTWLALMGGILLITLSVSAAFGAPPTSTDDESRGQTVAGFVHQLIFGQETPDEGPTDEEQEEEGEEGSQEEGSDELAEDEQQELVEEDEEADSHGACVSEVAHDKAGENDPEGAEYRNHGARVSEAARFLCWGLEVGDESDEESAETEAAQLDVADEEADDEARPGKSGKAKAHGKANAPGQQKAHSGDGPGNGGGLGRGGR
jgi:hypothetical protein